MPTTDQAMSQSLNADVNQKMSVAFLVEETSTSSAHNVSNHYNNLPSPVLSEAQSSRSSRYSCYSEPPLSSTMRVRSEHEFHPYFSQQEHQRSVARHTAPPLGCSPMSTKQSLRHNQTSSITALPPPLSETSTVFHTGLFIKPRPRQYKKKHQISPSHSNQQQQQSLLKDDHPPVSSSASCTSTTSSTTSTQSTISDSERFKVQMSYRPQVLAPSSSSSSSSSGVTLPLEKNFTCKYSTCGRSFRRYHDLQRHLKSAGDH